MSATVWRFGQWIGRAFLCVPILCAVACVLVLVFVRAKPPDPDVAIGVPHMAGGSLNAAPAMCLFLTIIAVTFGSIGWLVLRISNARATSS